MQKLRKDHFMALENYVDINDSNVEAFGGAIGNILFKNKSKVNKIRIITNYFSLKFTSTLALEISNLLC